MVTVGVRELKNQLSHFRRLVQRGEQVLVTDHGRVVAKLRPADEELMGVRLPFAALAERGAIRRPLIDGDPLVDWPKKAIASAGFARALIDEDRGD